MAISRVSFATNNGNTINIGTHASGDLIVICAYRDNSTTPPSLPSGWYGLATSGGSAQSYIVGWKTATTSSETSGTWTSATSLHAIVYRPASSKIIVPKLYSVGAASSTSVAVNLQISGSFETNSDDLWLLAFVMQRNASNSLNTATWTGLSNVTSSTDSSLWQFVANDTNATRTTAWTTQTATVTNSAAWRTLLLGLQEFSIPAASGGGMFFRPGMSGGMSE